MSSSSNPRVKHIAQGPRGHRKRPRSNQPQPMNQNEFAGPGGSTAPKLRVCPESFVNISDFEGTNVYDALAFQGIIGYVENAMETIPPLVVYFYKHFKLRMVNNREWNITIAMDNGSRYRYSNVDFHTDFNLNDEYGDDCNYYWDAEPQNWPRGLRDRGMSMLSDVVYRLNNLDVRPDITQKMTSSPILEFLNGDDKVLLKIVKEVLLPCNNKDNKVTQLHAVVLAMLKYGIKFSLPWLILHHMSSAPENKKCSTLPYGGLITKIMVRWGIDVVGTAEAPRKPLMIGRSTYIKQGSILMGKRLIQDWEAEFLAPEERVVYDELYQERVAKRSGQRVAPPREEHTRAQAEHAADEVLSDPQEEDDDVGRLSVSEKLDRILAGQKRQEKRQGRIMKFLLKLGEKCGCSAEDVEELAHSSPDV